MGRYRAAADAYRRVQAVPEERATALHFAWVAERIEGTLPKGTRLWSLVRISRHEWFGALGRPVTDEFSTQVASLQIVRFTERAGEVVSGPSVALVPTLDVVRDVSLYAPPALRPRVVVQTTGMAANCLPNELAVLTPRGTRFGVSRPFKSIYATRAWVERGRLVVSVVPTYKVWWPDVYEWHDGRFIFANRRHPEVYRNEKHPARGERFYAYWMQYAAALTIRRNRPAALAAWREAERCAAASLRMQGKGIPSDRLRYPDYGVYGDTAANLSEIRRRIRWLRRADLHHPLLYRPYDWGLQVPPYQLGNATGADPW
jgi:hypothetical protein